VSQVWLDGAAEKRFVITSKNGFKAVIMDIGATWISCTAPLASGERELLAGVDTIEQHIAQQAYLGATVGRYANRIIDSTFTVEGETHTLLPTPGQGNNCLHGGPEGFSFRRFEVVEYSDAHVHLRLVSPDGDQGFPGELTFGVEYRWLEDDTMSIRFTGQSTKTTPFAPTNHAYFNLDGLTSDSCLNHTLQVEAERFLPVSDSGAPTSTPINVAGTALDFRESKKLSEPHLSDDYVKAVKGVDHGFLLDHADAQATLTSGDGQVSLIVSTTMPAMQVYTGNWLAGNPTKRGELLDYNAVAIEPGWLADSPNHIDWPQASPFLKAGKTVEHTIGYRFVINS